MSTADFTCVTTVDFTHAEVIREALEGAGVTVRVVNVRPAVADWLPRQRPQLVDIEVPATDAARARAVLDLMEMEAQQAARAEAAVDEGDDGEPGDRKRARTVAARMPLSAALGLLLALVFPVAGPIYAGARRLTWVSVLAHGGALTMYLLGSTHHWYRDELHANLGLLALGAARFFDVVATRHAIDRHNARLDRAAPAPDTGA